MGRGQTAGQAWRENGGHKHRVSQRPSDLQTSLGHEDPCSVAEKLNHPTVEFKNYLALKTQNSLDHVFLASGVFLIPWTICEIPWYV